MQRTSCLLGALLLSTVCGALGAQAPAASAGSLGASLPVRRDGDTAADAGTLAPALALIVLAGAGGAWVWWRSPRRLARGPTRGGQIVRLSSQPLTTQVSVHALQWRGEELLVACSAQEVTVLSRRSAAAEGDEP